MSESHMSYPKSDCPLRTDKSFRDQADPAHHRTTTPLTLLPIDMVKDFAVADSLHLMDLGIMKRCLKGWTKGTLKKKSKWSAKQIKELSTLLQNCNAQKPTEIHRAIRKLDCLSFWKGTEYRAFLLYLGPVVLKDHLEPRIYQHFMTFFCAVTICSSDTHAKFIDIADSLFKDYIDGFIHIYGRDMISSNVHNLCHVVEDVKRFGNLSNISAYPFENALYSIKLQLRSGNRPLAQIAKRMEEMLCLNDTMQKPNSYPIVKNQIKAEQNLKQFASVYLDETTMLSNTKKNMWFLNTDNDIVAMEYATCKDEKIFIFGSTIKSKCDFFTEPFESSFLNIFTSVDSSTFNPKLHSVKTIKCKLFCLKYGKQNVFFPLLHTYHKLNK